MPQSSPRRPPPLVVAATLAAVEGVFVLGYGVLLGADIHADRVAMGITSSIFFAVVGAALVACGWFLSRSRTWARSPVVVAQLMFLGLAWSFLGGATTWVSVFLALAALLVLAGLLHPASIDALSDRDEAS